MQALALGPNGDGTTRRKDKEDNDPTTRRPHHSNSGPAILLELPRVRALQHLSMDATASMASQHGRHCIHGLTAPVSDVLAARLVKAGLRMVMLRRLGFRHLLHTFRPVGRNRFLLWPRLDLHDQLFARFEFTRVGCHWDSDSDDPTADNYVHFPLLDRHVETHSLEL